MTKEQETAIVQIPGFNVAAFVINQHNTTVIDQSPYIDLKMYVESSYPSEKGYGFELSKELLETGRCTDEEIDTNFGVYSKPIIQDTMKSLKLFSHCIKNLDALLF